MCISSAAGYDSSRDDISVAFRYVLYLPTSQLVYHFICFIWLKGQRTLSEEGPHFDVGGFWWAHGQQSKMAQLEPISCAFSLALVGIKDSSVYPNR